MMKVAHVVDSMEVGGAETLVAQMCSAQREEGHAPRVYAVATLGPLGKQMQTDGFTVQANIGRHIISSARQFLRIFADWRPDVVHLHNPTPTIHAALSARMVGVPCIVSTRHSLVAAPHRLKVELKYAVAATCCDWVVGICDATTNNMRSLHSVPSRKLVRVYNGIVPLKRVATGMCPVKTGFTLLYVGRLAPVKNHSLLLRAFRSALSAMPDLNLWMVGDGSERQALEALAAELNIATHVTFWGQQLDVAPFFSAADVFIMSSLSEGLPLSLLQAFSLGLPSIVTDVGGMSEVVRISRAGIASRTDPESLAAAILQLARNEADRQQFSENAQRSFHAHFTLRAMVKAYSDLYGKTMVSPTDSRRGVKDGRFF